MIKIKKILSSPVIIAILSRLWLFIVAGMAILYFPFRERPEIENYRALPKITFLDGWTRWDGGWYVSIATQGYYFNPGAQSNVAFFPLYPLTIKLFMLVFKNPFIGGIIVSNLAFIIGIFFFHKLIRESIVKDEDKSLLTTVFLIFFPYSFFFSAVYSESLFFMCVVLSFYFAEKRKWLFSGLFGMLASADRFVGIALFPAIALKYLASLKEAVFFVPQRERIHNLPILLSSFSIGLIPLGLIGYMAFLYFKFDDPLAFAHTIGSGWEGMKSMNPNPLLPFISFVRTIINFSALPDNKYHVIFQFPIFLFFLVLSFYSFKYLGISYGIFSLAMLAIPVSVSIDLIGMGRYLLVIFPCFALIPILIKNRYLRLLLLTLSFFFLTLFTAMFATWWWVG